MTSELMHASCVCVYGKGVLLLGESGSGKSDLALRLIDGGGALVADDQVQITKMENQLMASAPESLRGMIEARGIGILSVPYEDSVPLVLAVKLVERAAIERLPESAFLSCLGVQLPLLSLSAFDASTPAKIRLLMMRP